MGNGEIKKEINELIALTYQKLPFNRRHRLGTRALREEDGRGEEEGEKNNMGREEEEEEEEERITRKGSGWIDLHIVGREAERRRAAKEDEVENRREHVTGY